MKNIFFNILITFLFFVISEAKGPCNNVTLCSDGVILPAWQPINTSKGNGIVRAAVYFIVLFYTFLGVSIVADRFMMAIERITSQEKEVEVLKKTGEICKIRVRIWNETVSNLTLMALGSSAPEILLSVIEICGKDFQAGALGPGTIVGSAAFNLFIIIGLCIMVIPPGEVRRIKHLPVFIITASFSVLAYIWLYLILGAITPGVIDVWEAVITLLFFPLVVILAYLADRKIYAGLFAGKRYGGTGSRSTRRSLLTADERDAQNFEQLRGQYIQCLQELRKEHPTAALPTLESMAIQQVFGKSKKSRAFYRIHATRLMTGGGNVLAENLAKVRSDLESEEVAIQNKSMKAQTIHFDPIHYTVMENVDKVTIRLKRSSGYMDSKVTVKFQTEDGTAVAGSDYIQKSGTVVFEPFKQEATIDIEILDDDTYEEDEHFSIIISDLQVENGKEDQGYTYEISSTNKATVMILDDDHAGIFFFQSAILDVSESCGLANVVVQRSTGARGNVVVPFKTVDGTAKDSSDYTGITGELLFKNNETTKTINISIHDDGQYERNEYFFVKLGDPRLTEPDSFVFKKSKRSRSESIDEGKPKLGDWNEIKVNIHESNEFKNTVDRLVKRANITVYAGADSWKDQFRSAIYISETDENGNPIAPSLLTCILHYLSMFWKLLFACIPPTEYAGGWLCFFVSVIAIGLMTALIGDLASSFGCSIGLMDEVTAITFVAIGTSLPDTFASKVAATTDEHADSSIGNVTGSNAVNVFLGLGVAWTLAAVVNAVRGNAFIVPVGSLGFSVTVFTVLAVIAIILLLLKRLPKLGGGELGGPNVVKRLSALILVAFFFIYVILSSLQSYCII